MLKKILLLVAVLLPMSGFAQKFGVVDVNTIFAAMPETTAAQNQLQESSKKFQDELQKLTGELEKLYGEFQSISEDPNTPQSIKERRMQEIQEKGQKVEEFRQAAERDLGNQQQQLLAPVQQKLTDAIKAVGQEGGFTMVFPKEEGLLLYTGTDVVDLTDTVKARLGM